MLQTYLEKARALGFDQVGVLDVATLKAMPAVRDMCRADSCRAYGKNWTCPPYCGSLEACARELASYNSGILLQTVGKLQKTIDSKGMQLAEQRHLRQFHQLARWVRQRDPQVLCLGAGGCRICPVCAWPEACRFPEEACSSMEAYGLFVTQVCRDNGMAYHYGDRTITFTACILLDKKPEEVSQCPE